MQRSKLRRLAVASIMTLAAIALIVLALIPSPIEVETPPLFTIPNLISSGVIDHALVICAFWWLAQRRPEHFKP